MRRSLLKYLLIQTIVTTGLLATPISADGSWHQFLFGRAVSPVVSCGGVSCTPTANPVAEDISSPPWTFSGPGILTVLDLFNAGDRFEAFNNAFSIGTTTVVANTGATPCGNDIGCALADPTYSRLVIGLGGGNHSLTFDVITNAVGTSGGAAVFQVAPIPEPGTFLLLGGAMLSLGLIRRRR